MLAISRQHFFGIAAAGQTALVEPPDLIGQLFEQRFFVGDEEDRFAGAPQSVELQCRLLAFQRVLAGQRFAEHHHRLRARPLHRARSGPFHARRQTQQLRFPGSILSDDADDDAIRHVGVEITQGFRGHMAKREGHRR